MEDPKIRWPEKTRDLHSHHFNSTIWDQFVFRDDDIIIATYAKSGTTWLQQIISQLIFNGQEGHLLLQKCRHGWTCGCPPVK